MKPILQALGYFSVMIVLYTINTILMILLLGLGGVAVVPGAYLAVGALTIAEGIVAAVMSFHYWDAQKDMHKVEHDNDQKYRMELLRIAEEEKNGLEETPVQLQVESQENTYRRSDVYYPTYEEHLQAVSDNKALWPAASPHSSD